MGTRLLTRRRLLLAKIETTYGTDPVPTGAANAILVKNLNITPLDATLVSRDLVRTYLGNSPQLIADGHVKIDFEVEIAGAGAAGSAPAYGPLLRGCGLSETLTALTNAVYKPISTAFESVTLYFYQDGALHSITGARGDLEINLQAKQIPTFKFTFTGIYNPPSAVALPSPTYTGFTAPLVANDQNTPSFSLLGYSPVLDKYSLKLGNQVEFRSLIGSQYVAIMDRKVSGQVTFEAVTPDVKDYFGPAIAATLGDMTVTHGTVAGNKVTIDAPTVNIQNPTYTDNSGVQMLQVPYVAVPNVGNDELTITVA